MSSSTRATLPAIRDSSTSNFFKIWKWFLEKNLLPSWSKKYWWSLEQPLTLRPLSCNPRKSMCNNQKMDFLCRCPFMDNLQTSIHFISKSTSSQPSHRLFSKLHYHLAPISNWFQLENLISDKRLLHLFSKKKQTNKQWCKI